MKDQRTKRNRRKLSIIIFWLKTTKAVKLCSTFQSDWSCLGAWMTFLGSSRSYLPPNPFPGPMAQGEQEQVPPGQAMEAQRGIFLETKRKVWVWLSAALSSQLALERKPNTQPYKTIHTQICYIFIRGRNWPGNGYKAHILNKRREIYGSFVNLSHIFLHPPGRNTLITNIPQTWAHSGPGIASFWPQLQLKTW